MKITKKIQKNTYAHTMHVGHCLFFYIGELVAQSVRTNTTRILRTIYSLGKNRIGSAGPDALRFYLGIGVSCLHINSTSTPHVTPLIECIASARRGLHRDAL